jgi:hypothetical protein
MSWSSVAHADLDEYEIILEFNISVLDNNDKIFRSALEAYLYEQDNIIDMDTYLLQELEDICATDFDTGHPSYDSLIDAKNWLNKIKQYAEDFKVLAFYINAHFNKSSITLDTHAIIPIGVYKINLNKIKVLFRIESQ